MAQWSETDTFVGRTVSSNTTASLGTASDGETYTCLSGNGSNTVFAVSSGEGLINSTSGGQIVIMKLGSNTGTDMMSTVRMSPGSATDTIDVFVRLTDSTHYYRLAIGGGNTTVALGMKNGGSFVSLANSSNLGFTCTAGTFYWLQLLVIGTTISGKCWVDGSAEPNTWNVTAIDTNIASGGTGFGCNVNSTTNAQFDTFNSFTIDAALSDANTFSDTPTITATPKPVDSNSFADSMTKTGAPTFSDSLTSSDAQVNTASSTKTTDTESTTDSYTDTAVFTRANSINNNNAYQSTILADTPIIYYRLNDIAGTVAHDSSGNAQNGTIGSGVTLLQPGSIIGDADTAMTFSGSGSQITIPQTNLPTGSSQWSVECWCMRPSFPASGQYNFALGFGTYGAPNHQMASIGFHWTSATVGHSILSTYSGDIEGSAIAPGVWYHVVGTFDGTNINLYTNGFLTNRTAEVPSIVLTFANVGAGSNTDRFTGSIDETAIYNYALTPTQVLAHYNAGTNFTYESIAVTEAQTLTDNNNAIEATTSTSSSAITETSLSSSDSLADIPSVKSIDQFNTTQNLTLWYLSSTTTTLPTATGLANVTGGSLGPQTLTTFGTGTGFGELHAQTYAGAWPALSSIGAPSGNGYLFDSTLLEGMTILARTQSPSLFLNTSPGTEPITADIYMRLFKYNQGSYGLIATGLLSGQTISTGGGFGIPTTWVATAFGIGDKLYIDTWINVLANTNSDATLKIVMQGRSSSGLGVSGQNAYGQLQYSVGPDLLVITDAQTMSDSMAFDDSAFSDTSIAKPFDAGNLTDVINDTASSTVIDSSSATDTSSNTSNTTRTSSLSLVDSFTETTKESFSDASSFTDTSAHVDSYLRANSLGSSYNSTIMSDRPMAYYRLDETSGPTAFDQMNNANATYKSTGVTYSQVGAIVGDTDTSVLLDGTTGRIDCLASLSTTGLSAVSVECWIKLATTSYSGLPRLIANDFAESTKNGFELLLGSSDSGGLFYVGNGTSSSAASIGSLTYSAGIWYHIVGAWDGTTIRIYVNGVQKGTSSLSGTINASAHNIGIGYNPAYNGDFLNGKIDEVAIYSYALTAAQVLNHYNIGTAFQNETIILAEAESLVDAYSLDDSKTNLQLSETQNDTPAPLTEASTTNTAFTDGIMQWSDTFSGRTVATNASGNWGQASSGEFWSCLQGVGSPTTLSVATGEGTISEVTGSGIVIMRLGQKSAADTEVLCRIAPGVTTDSIYVFTRLIDNIHYYRMDFSGSNLQLAKKAGGGFTTIISSGIGMASTPGTFYWLRFRAVGTTLFGKVWVDGTQEPISWLVTATDTSNTTGGVGCGCNPQSSTNVQFDNFSAYTVIPADATFVDFIALTENASLTDPYQFLDNIFLVDVNSTKLLFTTTNSRSGMVSTTSRGN